MRQVTDPDLVNALMEYRRLTGEDHGRYRFDQGTKNWFEEIE